MHDPPKLGGRNPWIALLRVGKDVGDRPAIDGQRQTLASFQICNHI